MKKLFPLIVLVLLMLPCIAYGGATGKVSGRIMDKGTGQPLPLVNVYIPDLKAGAVSDNSGYYHIIGVPPGVYTVTARMMGYGEYEARDVRVIVDQTTTLNIDLQQEAIELTRVDVVAERIIPKDVTESKSVKSGRELEVMPVQTPEAALLAESNVVSDPALGEIHIRGGRGGEVLYLVDGMSIKDPLVGGGFGMRMGRNAVEEMAIITGGWSAEYGNAQSGVINMVTREGGEKMSGRLYYITDNLGIPALNEEPINQTTNSDITELSVGGPEPITQMILPALGVRLPGSVSYFASGTGEWTDTYYPYNVRRSVYEIGGIRLSDRQQNYYTANTKVTWNLTEQKNQKKLTFGFRGSWANRDGFDWKFRYTPESAYKVKEESYQTSLSWHHVMTASTFYTVNLSKFTTGREVMPGGLLPDEVVQYTGTSHGTSDDTLDVNMDYPIIDGADEPFVDREVFNGLYDFGEPFVDLNSTGFWEFGEPFTDLAAKNGHYDLGEPFRDWNGNGQWDGDEPFYDYGADGIKGTNDPTEGDGFYQLGEPWLDYNKNGVRDEKTADGFVDWGFDQWAQWHKRRSDIYTLKTDVTSQRGEHHQLKAGFEVGYNEISHQEIQYPWWQDVERGPVPGPWPNLGIFRDFYFRTPMTGAAYLQDKIETEGMVINAGLRVDFWGPGAQVDELREPRPIRIFGLDLGETDIEGKVSPRLGIAYPITERDLLYFSYGHFSQMPEFQYLYSDTTQFGGAIRLYGNPNLEAEKTIAYELGVKHAFNDRLALDLTGFFKDVRGLIDTEKRGVPPLTYQLFINKDYGNTRGIEIGLDKRYSNYIAGTASYTLSWAMGKSSSDRQGYDYDISGNPLPLREYPLSWDQRHSVTVNADIRAFEGERPAPFGVRLPDRWGINLLWQYGSGLPYTGTDSLASETPNDRRMPWTSTVDMKANKDFNVGRLAYSFVLEVTNLFDKPNVRSVHTDTGTPEGDGRDIERNPTNWGPRRNVSAGLSIYW
jgi:outer membrane receptor protein involved in Fe transport